MEGICVLVACIIFLCDAQPFAPSLSNDANKNIKHVVPIQDLATKFNGSRKFRDIPSTLRNLHEEDIIKEPNPKENDPSDGKNSFGNTLPADSDNRVNVSSSADLSPFSNIASGEHNFSVASENTESLSLLNNSTDSNVDHDSSTFSETASPTIESAETTRLASIFATFTTETTRSSLNNSYPEEITSSVFNNFKNTSMTAAVSEESSAAEHDLSTQFSNFNGSVATNDVTSNAVPFNSSHISSGYSTENIITAAFSETNNYVSNSESMPASAETTIYNPTAAVNLTSDEFPANQINETLGDDSVCSVCQNCTDSYIDRILSDVTASLPPFLELPNRQGRFQLYHGKLFGLGSLRRSDPAIVACKSGHEYAVMVPLRVRNAKAFYKWQVEMPLRTFYGDLNVTVRNAESRVFYSHSRSGSLVDNLKITALDDVDTSISGMGPISEVFAGAARVAIRMFRRSIAKTMENTLIHVINKELQDVKKYEEYYETHT